MLSKAVSSFVLISFLISYCDFSFVALQYGRQLAETKVRSACGMDVCCCSGSAGEDHCAMTFGSTSDDELNLPTCFFARAQCDPHADSAMIAFNKVLPPAAASVALSRPLDRVRLTSYAVTLPDDAFCDPVFHPPCT
jgi:hypothetical protein